MSIHFDKKVRQWVINFLLNYNYTIRLNRAEKEIVFSFILLFKYIFSSFRVRRLTTCKFPCQINWLDENTDPRWHIYGLHRKIQQCSKFFYWAGLQSGFWKYSESRHSICKCFFICSWEVCTYLCQIIEQDFFTVFRTNALHSLQITHFKWRQAKISWFKTPLQRF